MIYGIVFYALFFITYILAFIYLFGSKKWKTVKEHGYYFKAGITFFLLYTIIFGLYAIYTKDPVEFFGVELNPSTSLPIALIFYAPLIFMFFKDYYSTMWKVYKTYPELERKCPIFEKKKGKS